MRRYKVTNILCVGFVILSLIWLFSPRTKPSTEDVSPMYHTNFDLYVDQYCPVEEFNITHDCLEKLNKFDVDSFKPRGGAIKEKIIYHTYWHNDVQDDFDFQMLSILIYSYIGTQDLKNTKLIIWSQKPFTSQKVTDTFEEYVKRDLIEFDVVMLKVLCNTYPFKLVYEICSGIHIADSDAFTDFFRYIVLYNYGGIFVESDTIFLRNMKPFWNMNFVYRAERLVSLDNSIMGLKKEKSENIEKIFYTMVTKEVVNDTKQFLETALKIGYTPPYESFAFINLFYGFKLATAVSLLNNGYVFSYPDFKVFNSALFDPSWLCHKKVIKKEFNTPTCEFEEFCEARFSSFVKIDKFYPGAFTFHWHSGQCSNERVVKKYTMFHMCKIHFKELADGKLKKLEFY